MTLGCWLPGTTRTEGEGTYVNDFGGMVIYRCLFQKTQRIVCKIQSINTGDFSVISMYAQWSYRPYIQPNEKCQLLNATVVLRSFIFSRFWQQASLLHSWLLCCPEQCRGRVGWGIKISTYLFLSATAFTLSAPALALPWNAALLKKPPQILHESSKGWYSFKKC